VGQFEHALPFVTKAYEVYLMSAAKHSRLIILNSGPALMKRLDQHATRAAIAIDYDHSLDAKLQPRPFGCMSEQSLDDIPVI
jgi:hypothetical protein